MPVFEIESDWRETPIICDLCKQPMYSDGRHRPQCAACLHLATDEQIYTALISPTSQQLSAEYNAAEMKNGIQIVMTRLQDIQQLLGEIVSSSSRISLTPAERDKRVGEVGVWDARPDGG